jgi:hypothetical protein
VSGIVVGNQPQAVGPDPAGELVRAVATFELRYKLKDPLLSFTEDEMQVFGATNGRYHAWPFLRECLHTLLNRLGFNGFMLPMLRLEAMLPGGDAEPAHPRMSKKSK